MTKPAVCLTVAGLDPSGGAGVIADVKTFSAFGCFATAAISSVTFQNTTGVFGWVHQSADSVRRQMEAVLDDYEVAAVKTGMLPTLEIIDAVAEIIGERRLQNLIVDPVVRSTSGYDLIDDSALRSVIERLFPLAALVTPNLPEAERICGTKIKSAQGVGDAARIMQDMGASNVLIKGGHAFAADKSGRAVDHLFLGEAVHRLDREFIETTRTHGTGCTLAAAIAANLALGRDLLDAVAIAKEFVFEAIRTAAELGNGNSPINIAMR